MTTPYVLPAAASRGDVPGTLKRERWHAADAGEWQRGRQIDNQLAQLTAQSTSTNPQRETTAATHPRRERRVSR